MIKCVEFIAILSIIMLNGKVHGTPQDIPEAAILAFAQVKDTFDNGAAASDKKELEFFGAKIKNEMGIGFGDAVRSKRSNQYPKEGNNFSRTKRLSNVEAFTEQKINSEEKLISKRAADDNSFVVDDSDDYDDYYSSFSSSYEWEDTERRKRSATFDQFTKDMKKNYLIKN